jgi:hypothetical protein
MGVEKSRDKIQRIQKYFSHEGAKAQRTRSEGHQEIRISGRRISENQDIRE